MDVNRGIAYIIHLLVTIIVLILCAFPMTHLPSPLITITNVVLLRFYNNLPGLRIRGSKRGRQACLDSLRGLKMSTTGSKPKRECATSTYVRLRPRPSAQRAYDVTTVDATSLRPVTGIMNIWLYVLIPGKHLVLFTCSKFTRTRGREVYLEHVIALTVRKIKYFWHCDYYNRYSSSYNSRLRLSHNYAHELYATSVPWNYNHMPWVSLYLPLMDSHCLLWEAKFRVGRARKQSCLFCAWRIFKNKRLHQNNGVIRV